MPVSSRLLPDHSLQCREECRHRPVTLHPAEPGLAPASRPATHHRRHEAFSKDPRFAMISLSLDEKRDDVRYVVKSQKLSWPHAFIGSESSVATSYHATAIPAILLIGPDGTVLARDLKGTRLKTAIGEMLNR